jgi:diketogulonate reductase-like aldo/keto reductase
MILHVFDCIGEGSAPSFCYIAVIPKSNNINRLKQNLDVLNFDLEPGEIQKISGLDIGFALQ